MSSTSSPGAAAPQGARGPSRPRLDHRHLQLDVDAWAEYLGHPQLTVALLDKLVFRAVALKIDGPSYRLAEHKKRQLTRKANKTATP